VLAEDLLPALALPRGVGDSISTLTYYGIVFIWVCWLALAMAGFQVGQLAIVFGALGVGIGFGLQDVVKNFVAGLILMFERPIRLGDVVDVAGMSGKVRDIGMRATIITTFDGAEVVVPNGMLLADKLVNWTLSGTQQAHPRRHQYRLRRKPAADDRVTRGHCARHRRHRPIARPRSHPDRPYPRRAAIQRARLDRAACLLGGGAQRTGRAHSRRPLRSRHRGAAAAA
jgi:hypothetical protein